MFDKKRVASWRQLFWCLTEGNSFVDYTYVMQYNT